MDIAKINSFPFELISEIEYIAKEYNLEISKTKKGEFTQKFIKKLYNIVIMDWDYILSLHPSNFFIEFVKCMKCSIEKLNKDEFVEIGEISPDWNIATNKELQNITIDHISLYLQIDKKFIWWIENEYLDDDCYEPDTKTRLVIDKKCIQDWTTTRIDIMDTYIQGFLWGISYA
jgi:hypothetical protein